MAVFFNSTETIGTVVIGLTGITGSLFLTLLAILIILIVIALALKIPIEAISIIFLPLLITLTSYTRDFLGCLGILLIYAGFIIGKNLLKNG
jgi:hypothetical protein